jgi:phytoene dehydrogenase-like protein
VSADVVVIGAGHNGLVAAILLAEAGLQVQVLEANSTVGGAVRTAEVTLPGFKHDLCSSFYPLFPVGPISELPLDRYGLEWCDSPRPYGGGTPDGRGVAQARGGAEDTAAIFEWSQPGDGVGWRELYEWWEWGGPAFLSALFNPLGHPAPLLRGAMLLRSPRKLLEFSQLMISSAVGTAERFFSGTDAQVWFAGSALHSDLAPEDAGGGAFSMTLSGLGQQVGMPIPRGGAQAIPEALRRMLEDLGGSVLTDQRVRKIVVRKGRAVAVRTESDEFPIERAVLATVEPQGLFLDLVGEGELPSDFVKLVRRYRWGTGVFRFDCALSGLPRFKPEAFEGTLVLHLARSVEELSRGVGAARRGVLPAHPLLIAGVQTLVDPSRAPAGQHTFWAETHVPTSIRSDDGGKISARTWAEAKEPFAERILDEMEAYAPGFRDLVLATHAETPDDLYASNANLVRGDIAGGTYTLDQQLVFRPFPGWFRYKTPIRGLYMSGASTHPGGGVHGACGDNAARVMLTDFRLKRMTERLDQRFTDLGERLRQRAPGLSAPREQ